MKWEFYNYHPNQSTLITYIVKDSRIILRFLNFQKILNFSKKILKYKFSCLVYHQNRSSNIKVKGLLDRANG